MVILVLGITYVWTNSSETTPKNSSDNRRSSRKSADMVDVHPAKDSVFMGQYGQNCKERDVAFTSLPMAQNDIGYIRPMGAMSDSHVTPTDHIYIHPANPSAGANAYAVIMPADGTVFSVAAMPSQYIGDRNEQKTATEDHNIWISHSCRYFSNFIHINKLSDKLAAAAGQLEPGGRGAMTNIELKAGEIVGYIGEQSFDWIAVDTHTLLKGFITPSLYEQESWKIYTANPFDLYKGALKAELEAKSLRMVAPRGGKIDYDQPGRLIGNWFREGTGGYSGNTAGGRSWDGHLSIAPDSIDPASTIVSIGNWTGAAAQFVVSGSADPAAVQAGSDPIKYELKMISYVTADGGRVKAGELVPRRLAQDTATKGTIMFQVLPGEKLKVEKFPGKTASQVTGFTAAAQTYER